MRVATSANNRDFTSASDVVYGTNDSTNGDFDGGGRSLPSSSAAVTNRGQTAGETTVELTLDGSVVDSQTVALEGEETVDVTLSVTPDAPGEYDVAAGGIDLGGLTVEAVDGDAASEATPADDAGSEATAAEKPGDSGLPVGPIAAVMILVAVPLAGGLWWRRQ